MPDNPPIAELVFRLKVRCDPPVPIGRLQGGAASMIAIIGGTVEGPRLLGEVLPGGADWSIRRDDGVAIVDARYAIRASDGAVIQIFNAGSIRFSDAMRGQSAAGQSFTALTQPRFIAPEGPHDWLNHAVFAGTLTPDLSAGFSVQIGIYQIKLA